MSKIRYSKVRRSQFASAVLRMQDSFAAKLQRSVAKELRTAASAMAAEYKATGKLKNAKKAHETRLKAVFKAAMPPLCRAFIKVPTIGATKSIVLPREEKRKVVGVQAPDDWSTDDLELEREVIEFATRGAIARAPGIASTTDESARRVIARGLSAGKTTAEISKDISKTLGGLTSAARAATIARTTVHSAANISQDAGAKSTGLDFKREWIATNDDRVRETHQEVDGQMVGKDEDFDVGGEAMAYPGDPAASPENTCNCRCVVGYIFSED